MPDAVPAASVPALSPGPAVPSANLGLIRGPRGAPGGRTIVLPLPPATAPDPEAAVAAVATAAAPLPGGRPGGPGSFGSLSFKYTKTFNTIKSSSPSRFASILHAFAICSSKLSSVIC